MNYAASKKLALLPCLKTSLKALIVFGLVTWRSVGVNAQNYQWAGATNGNGMGKAAGRAITRDSSGNVYVAGSFNGLMDFDPGSNSALLYGNGDDEGFLAKYDANGNYLWAISIGGYRGDGVDAIALDGQGNIIVMGSFGATADFDPSSSNALISSLGSADVFIAKYDPNGHYIWAKALGGQRLTYAGTISVDASGNIYVSGEFDGTVDFDPGMGTYNLSSEPGYSAGYVAKYDADGDFIWANRVGKLYVMWPVSSAIGPGGYVYVTGPFKATTDFDPGPGVANLTPAGEDDIFLCKFDQNGALIFAKAIGGVQNEEAWSISVNSGGYIYISGWFLGTTDFDPSQSTALRTSMGGYDIFFAKYDADGNYQWANAIGGPDDDNGISIATNSFGTVVLTGSFRDSVDFDPSFSTAKIGSNGLKDAFVAKYGPDGHYQWAFGLGGDRNDYGNNISLGATDEIYITGGFHNMIDFDPSLSTANLYANSDTAAFWAKYADPALSATPAIHADVTVYPNPTHDMIRFSKVVNVELHHITGVSILRAKNVTSLDLGDYESGIYIATLTNASGRVLQRLKLIKE